MGDQVGQAVDGNLVYIPYTEFERIRSLSISRGTRVSLFADMCRFNVLYMIARAGSGHIGSSFSSLDIVSWLLLEELDLAPTPQSPGDVFLSSKGHDAPGYYSALIGLGKLDFELLHKLRRIDGLPGHPDVATTGIATNTGSLGMGISKAKGMVWANRFFSRSGRVFVMTGDGELQEGQFWESLISAANHGLHEITAIIDHNKLQSDTFVKQVSDLGDLEAKLQAFGWRVERCDGHDLAAFEKTLHSLRGETRPQIIIADTIKGRGVSFMEHTTLDSDVAMYRFHSGAPDADSYQRAIGEIKNRLSQRIKEVSAEPIKFENIQNEEKVPVSPKAQRLIPAYSQALLLQAEKHKNLVVLDADLVLDTGLIPFRDRYPERFFECGIAEQDMVSMAGGMALKGLIPLVHSFACFLSARPNEQIYNNASEKTKVIYVGSLAGVIPGGPGHSHQAVRDISTLAAIPNLISMEPSCEDEVNLLLNWCLNETDESSYLRLVSIPCEIPFQLPKSYRPNLGQGVTLVEGTDVVLIAYGPVLLSAAVEAADHLLKEKGMTVKVLNLPWLNRIDDKWLRQAVGNCPRAFCLDNHYQIGGQGELIAKTFAAWPNNQIDVQFIGLTNFPSCGTNSEVLSAEKLDPEHLIRKLTEQ
ncbi:MAG: transketolase C-terminal domain-containing protein [Nitrospirales bacterium]